MKVPHEIPLSEAPRLRDGVAVCSYPNAPNSLYMRCMYHEFFYGPFKDEHAVSEAIAQLDKADPYWDYDCFCIHYGANPLPDDFVNGFHFVTSEQRNAIESEARPDGKIIPER